MSARISTQTSAGGGGGHARLIATGYGSHGRRKLRYANLKGGKVRYASRYGYGGLQCVPFARAASGIEIKGNAANWWDAAAGVYERGSRPEPGSVLNFRSTYGMRLGHVAVVTAVLNTRMIEIEHANWTKGAVARNVAVEDVSPENDWSAVRVALGRGGEFGSPYPTYGFIYDRPDSGTMLANNAAGAPVTAPDAPTGAGAQVQTALVEPASYTPAGYSEVAEAPPVRHGRHHYVRKPIYLDLPSRGILQ